MNPATKRTKAFSYLLHFLGVLSFCMVNAQTKTLAVVNANIITMTDSVVLRNKALIVKNGKIESIVNNNIARFRQMGFQVVDAQNGYIMPGLFDMHLHFYKDQGLDGKYLDDELKLSIMNGVLTARIMNGNADYLRLKKRTNAGGTPGPELFVVSPQVVGKWPYKYALEGVLLDSVHKVRPFVRQIKANGYDAVKLTEFIDPTIHREIMKVASEMGLKVTGHLGNSITFNEGVKSGQQIEHMDQLMEAIIPDTSMVMGVSVSDRGIYDVKKAWPTIRFASESRLEEAAKSAAFHRAYITPTNNFFITWAGEDIKEDSIQRLPGYRYVPAFYKKSMLKATQSYWSAPISDDLRRQYVYLRLLMVRKLHQAGVKLMTGSDSPEWFIVPGFAIHDELQMLTRAGLSNYEALRAATVLPAEYLGIAKRKGALKTGMDADIIILSSNPLDNIRNTRSIAGVLRKGKYFDRNALNRLSEEALTFSGAESQ